jgi:CDP-paratose 2-epimerase
MVRIEREWPSLAGSAIIPAPAIVRAAMTMRILVTGGAGFVGSSLALRLKRDNPAFRICTLDNLRRRGSELALTRLREGGIEFVHGDVRSPDDLSEAGAFDLLLECSAEPSVQAGYAGSPAYVVQTNLGGTAHCLEAARHHGAGVIFLSTSRVYPIARLRALPLARHGNRLDLPVEASGMGWSHAGVTSEFPLTGHRSLYGATKLASELLVEEYRAMYGLRAIINRCGVISGPWQMGKIDQGFVVLWASRHLYGGELTFSGFGGEGLQVRDVLHIEDLCDLIQTQIEGLSRYDGAVWNVGGGRGGSLSLMELTDLCRARADRALPIGRQSETSAADVPWYVTDNSQVGASTGWRPRRSLETLLDDVFGWLRAERATLEPILGSRLTNTPSPSPAAS